MTIINPGELGQPRGWSNGILAPSGGRLLFVAGQTAADANGHVAERGFVSQFDQALGKALSVIAAAGGGIEHIGRITTYVTDMEAYRASRPKLSEVWQRHMGHWYPAMALVEVSRLVDHDASVEIEMTAVIPDREPGASA
ncbi:MAG: RidA family protein [Acidobacteria bacterium]|nr:RidA family protein [Acidobacteriota bacterium]